MLNNKLSLNTFIFILAIIAGVEVIGLFCSPAPPPQYNQEKTQQENYTPGHTVSLSIFKPLLNNTKQGLHCIVDWIDTNNDIVMALATIAIALFTFTLWQTSQEHSRHMEASIAVAQKAADAAKKSADALPAIERAYIFVKVRLNNPQAQNEILIGEGISIQNQVEIIMTNHGKTPAIVLSVYKIAHIWDEHQIDKALVNIISSIDTFDPLYPPGTIIIDDGEGKPTSPTYFLMKSEYWKDIINHQSKLVCLGCIKYKDIFDQPHITVFCWEYDQISGFYPDIKPGRNYQT